MTKFSEVPAAGITIRESANDGSDFTNPIADYRRLFLGEDGALHLKSSAGTVTAIGGAGDITTDAAWAAKGDLIVGTANNTAAVLTAGTNGKVLTAASGEATGLKWDTPAAGSGGLYDDAFTSLAAWTQLGTLDTTSISDVSGYWHAKRACSNEIDGIYQAVPATPFTVTVKIPAFALLGNAHPSLGIMLLDATPTAVREFSLNFASGATWGVSLRRYSNRTTFVSSVDVAVVGPPADMVVFLRLLVTSATSVTFSYSYNGLIWTTPASLAAIDSTITPAYWGLLLSDPVSASSPELYARLPVVT